MPETNSSLQLAVKSTPDPAILSDIEAAGIDAVEIYANAKLIKNKGAFSICKDFPFTYALHAPNDAAAINETFRIAKMIGAKVVVVHDIYWENEWSNIVKISKESRIPLAIENIDGLFTFQKVLLKYDVSRCLDIEHLLYELGAYTHKIIKNLLTNTIHVHMTGYEHGSDKFHTHIYDAKEQTSDIMKCIKDSNYNGMVVSEASVEYQTKEHFQKLKNFFDKIV